MFYDQVNPQTGEVRERDVADTWGYVADGFTRSISSTARSTATRRSSPLPLSEPTTGTSTGSRTAPLGSADGYADSIEER
jgi:hypothetical protein